MPFRRLSNSTSVIDGNWQVSSETKYCMGGSSNSSIQEDFNKIVFENRIHFSREMQNPNYLYCALGTGL